MLKQKDFNKRTLTKGLLPRGVPDTVLQLLNAGVDANFRYGHGLTALMWAAGHDADVGEHTADSVIKLLVARDARLDAADDRGRTALMIAAEVGHSKIVETLLSRCADPMVRDKEGRTALDLAADARMRYLLATNQQSSIWRISLPTGFEALPHVIEQRN